jgi:two-component system cell cycle response regulator
MDAKASTHVCVSPLPQTEPNTLPAETPAVYLIVVSGGITGSMILLNEHGTSLGRSPENTFQFEDITVSRHHAAVAIDADGGVHVTDQGSSNGTFVNGKRIRGDRPVRLQDGDRIQLGSKVVLKLVRLDPHDERFQRELFERSVRDTLTSLYNRAYFLNQIGVLAERHAARGLGMALLMLDIDHFKRVNDRYGHTAGDEVLREVAAVIRESTRSEDLVARYGGEEFVISLPVSGQGLAIERAENIRRDLAARRIVARDDELHVTASVGLSFAPPGRWLTVAGLILAADQALYQAKAGGRNRVVAASYLVQTASKETDSVVLFSAG